MSYISGDIEVEWKLGGSFTKLIKVSLPTTTLDVQDLINIIRDAEASFEGIQYSSIADASGKEDLDTGVQVGLTVSLAGTWQIQFEAGTYIAKVAGGNLVGGPSGDPIAYSAGVQVLLIQSAASTVVTAEVSGGTADKVEDMWNAQGHDVADPVTHTDSTISTARQTLTISGDETTKTVQRS